MPYILSIIKIGRTGKKKEVKQDKVEFGLTTDWMTQALGKDVWYDHTKNIHFFDQVKICVTFASVALPVTVTAATYPLCHFLRAPLEPLAPLAQKALALDIMSTVGSQAL